ncbi:MAG: T9SS type A sorting domain-containing protein [Armatimonadetes bacterium]|nr:T9SS type A sorting domain-containing protein [Armatimonadota bacterium]
MSSPSGLSSPAGAETDGTYFYVSNSLSNEIAKFDLTGNWIENFSIIGLPFGLHDLTYDGTYFYAGDGTTNTIYEMDFSTQTIVSGISTPLPIRAIAYDPDQDAFWVTNWFTNNLFLIDRSGLVLNQFVFPINLNGLAHDSYTLEEPNLWISSGIYTGGDGIVEQLGLPTMAPTGLTHNVSEDFPGTHAGGLFCTDELDEYIVLLGGIAKGNPSYLFGYEVGYTPDAYAPEPPVDFTLTADPGGALEVTINWINPSVNLIGNPLTGFLEMRLYRDAVLIYTDTSAGIGAPCTYIDASVPSSGMYFYDLITFSDFGGSSVSDSVWVGPDVPDSVSNFFGEQTAPNQLSITLTWENPTQGLHGGPFLDPIVGYDLERSDGTLIIIYGMSNEITDDTIVPGVWYYYLTPYNSIGEGGRARSNDILVEITGIENDQLPMTGYQLSNFPNPFNPTTTIQFSNEQNQQNEQIELEIYNIKGQKIKTLSIPQSEISNLNSVVWNGTDENSNSVSSGIYFYQLRIGGNSKAINKLILIK